MYELPFGRGKRIRTVRRMPWSRRSLSGWQVQGIYTAQSGAALGFGNAIFVGDLHNIPLPKDQRNVDRWFNIDAGFNRNTATAARVEHPHFPVAILRRPRRRAEQLGHVVHQEHADYGKNPASVPRRSHQRAEPPAVHRAEYHRRPAPPFGTVTGEFAWPRVIQFGLKLLF